MKKILHIINGEFYSGAERVQDLLAINLPSYGYEAHVVCIKDGIFLDNCDCPANYVHLLPMKSRLDLGIVDSVVELAGKIQAEVIHTHTPRTALLGAFVAAKTGLRRVHHIHSPTIADTESCVRNIVNTAIERVSVIGTKRFIAVSESLGRWASKMLIPADRILTITNGVPLKEVDRGGLPDVPMVVGTVALFRPRKGLEVLLKAIAIAREQGANVSLRVVGGFETSEYESGIKELTDSLDIADNVIWCGFRKDVDFELARMHVFALPSLFGEGMPMVILEAMAAALPVVGTAVEGIPEVVRPRQEGLIVEPNNAEALASSIVTLATDAALRLKMGEAAKRRHNDLYSADVMAKHVAEVYSNVLSE